MPLLRPSTLSFTYSIWFAWELHVESKCKSKTCPSLMPWVYSSVVPNVNGSKASVNHFGEVWDQEPLSNYFRLALISLVYHAFTKNIVESFIIAFPCFVVVVVACSPTARRGMHVSISCISVHCCAMSKDVNVGKFPKIHTYVETLPKMQVCFIFQ